MADASKRQKTDNGGEDGGVGHFFDAAGLPAKIPYEGQQSRNPLAFKCVRDGGQGWGEVGSGTLRLFDLVDPLIDLIDG